MVEGLETQSQEEWLKELGMMNQKQGGPALWTFKFQNSPASNAEGKKIYSVGLPRLGWEVLWLNV